MNLRHPVTYWEKVFRSAIEATALLVVVAIVTSFIQN